MDDGGQPLSNICKPRCPFSPLQLVHVLYQDHLADKGRPSWMPFQMESSGNPGTQNCLRSGLARHAAQLPKDLAGGAGHTLALLYWL